MLVVEEVWVGLGERGDVFCACREVGAGVRLGRCSGVVRGGGGGGLPRGRGCWGPGGGERECTSVGLSWGHAWGAVSQRCVCSRARSDGRDFV